MAHTLCQVSPLWKLLDFMEWQRICSSRAREETGLPLHFLVGFPQIYEGKILGSGLLTDSARNDSTKKTQNLEKE